MGKLYRQAKYSWTLAKRVHQQTGIVSVRDIFSYADGRVCDESFLGHKSVICLPGNGVHFNDSDAMDRFSRKVQVALQIGGVPESDFPDIYVVGYDADTSVSHRLSLLEQQGEIDFLDQFDVLSNPEQPDNFHLFFEYYMAPLLQDEKGRAKEFNSALLNLQNITFVTFCHGSVLAKDIENRFEQLAKRLFPDRYPELISQLRMVHFASRAPLFHHQQGKHLHIISQNDVWYADRSISPVSLHRYFYQKKIKNKSTLIAMNPNEEVILFKDLDPSNEDQHGLVLSLLNYRNSTSVFDKCESLFKKAHNTIARILFNKKLYFDINDKMQQQLVLLMQKTLAHFVMHPQDTRSISEIFNTLSQTLPISQLEQEGKAYVGNIPQQLIQQKKHTAMASDLAQFFRVVLRDTNPKKVLHSAENGVNLYKSLLNNYQTNPKHQLYRENLVSFLKKAYLDLSPYVLMQGLAIAFQKKDWSMAHVYIKTLHDRSEQISQKSQVPARVLESTIRQMAQKDLPRVIEIMEYLSFSNTYEDCSLIGYLSDQASKLGSYASLMKQKLTQACEQGIALSIKRKSYVCAYNYLELSPLKVQVDKIGLFGSQLVTDFGNYDDMPQQEYPQLPAVESKKIVYCQIPPKEFPGMALLLNKINFGKNPAIYMRALNETIEHIKMTSYNHEKVIGLKNWLAQQKTYE